MERSNKLKERDDDRRKHGCGEFQASIVHVSGDEDSNREQKHGGISTGHHISNLCIVGVPFEDDFVRPLICLAEEPSFYPHCSQT